MELILLYFWMKLDAIGTMSFIIAISVTVFYMILATWIRTNNDGPFLEDPEKVDFLLKKHKSFRRLLLILGIIFWTIQTFLPTTKQAAILVGGYYALQFSNSEEGKKVKTLLQMTANNMLDDAIKAQTRK